MNNFYTLSPPHTCHNVVVNNVDESIDFYKFSKEEVISRLTEEVDEDAVTDQSVATTGNSETISRKPITTFRDKTWKSHSNKKEPENKTPMAQKKFPWTFRLTQSIKNRHLGSRKITQLVLS